MYSLKLLNVRCQVCLNKAGGRKGIIMRLCALLWRQRLATTGIPHPQVVCLCVVCATFLVSMIPQLSDAQNQVTLMTQPSYF